MPVTVVTPPEAIVSLETAKKHLRVEHSEDDVIIAAYVAAATGWIDGPGGWLGRSLGPQTLQATFDRFSCDLIPLPFGPLTEIDSVLYDDDDGAEQTVVDTDYTLDPRGVLLAYGSSWPSARYRAGAVRVTYQAGHETVPPAIIASILLMTGHLYQNREAVTLDAPETMPLGVESLLSPYRIWSLT